MNALANFPLVNQRTFVTFDGRPSENEDYNCLVANLVACIFYFHPEYIGKLSPDAAKDDVLTEAYTGSMDIRKFIAWAKAHGVNLQAFVASHALQVAEGHRQKTYPLERMSPWYGFFRIPCMTQSHLPVR